MFPPDSGMLKRSMFALGLFVAFLPVTGAPSVRAETVGAIIFTTARHDGAYNTLASDRTERAQAQFDLAVQDWVTTGRLETVGVLRSFARSGVDHVLVLGFENTQAVRTVAAEFPEVKFTIVDGLIPDMPNVRSIVFAEEESGFVAGYVAALKSETGTVGTIGGRDIPPVRRFMCGFASGVKYVDDDISILAGFVGTDPSAFRNIAGAHTLAQDMFAKGADIIFAPAGLAAEGVAEAAQIASAHVIMVDANKNGLLPGTVLTSALKRVDKATFLNWKSAVEGTWTPGVVTWSVRDNGVDWAIDDHNRALVSDIVDNVEALKTDLAVGKVAIKPADDISGCADVL